jgi:starch synthase
VPIVRETGGLRDTVVDYNPERLAAGQASGFTFAPLAVDALVAAVRRAEHVYRSDPTAWRMLITHIMGIDHSWQQSAREYAALYERLVAGTAAS